jgi:spermidine synthase
MLAACFLALATGLLSLSMEVIWVRFVSFSYHSAPQSFALVLFFYLIGIALGAAIGKHFCKTNKDLWVISGVTLLLSSICDLAGPWIYAHYVFANQEFPDHLWLIGGTVIAVTSLLKSIVFPIAHHLGTPLQSTRVGHAVSRVYVSNIAGATLGPILTGIILLAFVTTQQAFIICAILTLLVAVCCLWGVLNKVLLTATVLVLSVQLGLLFFLNGHDLISKVAITGYGDIINIVENQYGIVTVYKGPFHNFPGNRVVAGNNAYDGSTNLDPAHNFNGIDRVIIMSALVDHPKRVLMIGLSIGTWLKLVTLFPEVEAIDVIEINPSYLKLIKDYPPQQLALDDPRVHLYIDDGRRWLKAHPEQRYDMLVLNTTYHWRAYTSNLLSFDFLTLLKQHMNPGAVLGYNSTRSIDAFYTASTVFNYVYLYKKFIIAADFDWRKKLTTTKATEKLLSLKIDGRPLFAADAETIMHRFLQEPIVDLATSKQMLGIQRPLEIITDRNMITEFKYGKSL